LLIITAAQGGEIVAKSKAGKKAMPGFSFGHSAAQISKSFEQKRLFGQSEVGSRTHRCSHLLREKHPQTLLTTVCRSMSKKKQRNGTVHLLQQIEVEELVCRCKFTGGTSLCSLGRQRNGFGL
jgi:hypothetical protein